MEIHIDKEGNKVQNLYPDFGVYIYAPKNVFGTISEWIRDPFYSWTGETLQQELFQIMKTNFHFLGTKVVREEVSATAKTGSAALMDLAVPALLFTGMAVTILRSLPS